jgi:hypothetical protein
VVTRIINEVKGGHRQGTEILDRQHNMATAFADFAGYFIRTSCAR